MFLINLEMVKGFTKRKKILLCYQLNNSDKTKQQNIKQLTTINQSYLGCHKQRKLAHDVINSRWRRGVDMKMIETISYKTSNLLAS